MAESTYQAFLDDLTVVLDKHFPGSHVLSIDRSQTVVDVTSDGDKYQQFEVNRQWMTIHVTRPVGSTISYP